MPRSHPVKRWPYFRGQGALLAGAVAVFLGTALPWAVVLGELLWGSAAALTWTLSAAGLILGGSMLRRPWPSVVSAAAGAAIALFFAGWQTARILDRCLPPECAPGPGLGLLAIGGVTAAYQALQIARASAGYGSRS